MPGRAPRCAAPRQSGSRQGRALCSHSTHAVPPLTQHATSGRCTVLAQLRGARGGKLPTAGWSALWGAWGVCWAALAFLGGATAVLLGVNERESVDG